MHAAKTKLRCFTGGLRRISEDYGWTTRERRNGIDTAARVENISNRDSGRHRHLQRRTTAVHDTQHLAERKIKCAEAGLTRGGFVVVAMIVAVVVVVVGVGTIMRVPTPMQ